MGNAHSVTVTSPVTSVVADPSVIATSLVPPFVGACPSCGLKTIHEVISQTGCLRCRKLRDDVMEHRSLSFGVTTTTPNLLVCVEITDTVTRMDGTVSTSSIRDCITHPLLNVALLRYPGGAITPVAVRESMLEFVFGGRYVRIIDDGIVIEKQYRLVRSNVEDIVE